MLVMTAYFGGRTMEKIMETKAKANETKWPSYQYILH
jgi:hypothetical protein